MSMAIACMSLIDLNNTFDSIDACIYYNDGEIVIGSSVDQLSRTSPDHVIYHPLHFLDNRSDSSQNDQVIVCVDVCDKE